MPRVLTAEFSDMYPVLDLIAPPDLNQARVNKCLIALVNRKIVQKDNSTVRTLALLSFRINLTWLRRELFCIDGKGHHDYIFHLSPLGYPGPFVCLPGNLIISPCNPTLLYR
jgi:hypothetical protein